MPVVRWLPNGNLGDKIAERGLVMQIDGGINNSHVEDDDADDPTYNTGRQGDGKPSEWQDVPSTKKWGMAKKAHMVPGPKMGARPHQGGSGSSSRGQGTPSSPAQMEDLYVCCQRTRCRGVRGRPSFRMVTDILESQVELKCIACDAPWEWSFEQAVIKGQVPGFQPAKGKGKGKPNTLPSNPHQKMESPFSGSNSQGNADNNSPPFAAKAGSVFAQASIPQEAWDARPAGHVWQGYLKAILLGGKEESERFNELIEKNADKGSADCQAVRRAVIIAKAAKAPTPAPRPQTAGAPKPQPQQDGDQPLTIDQKQRAAYTDKQAATAEVQRIDKALNESVRLHRLVIEKEKQLEIERAAAGAEKARLASSLEQLRQNLKVATEQQALATQKLEALNIQLEKSSPASPELLPPAAPKPAPCPALPTQDQLASLFNLDNLNLQEQNSLNAASEGFGPEAKGFAETLAQFFASRVLSAFNPAPPPPGDGGQEGKDKEPQDEEAKCEYSGSQEQLEAWEKAMSAAGQTAAPAASSSESANPAEPSPVVDPLPHPAGTDTMAAVSEKKRPAGDEDDDFFAAEEANAASLHEDASAAPTQAKKPRGEGPLADATSEEVASIIIQELAEAAALPQQSSADIPEAAVAGSSSG